MIRRLLHAVVHLDAALRATRAKPTTDFNMPAAEVFVGESESPLSRSEELHGKRVEAAMSLTDDDTYGYVVMVLKKPKGADADGRIDIQGYVQPEWWPAFVEMTDRIGRVGASVG